MKIIHPFELDAILEKACRNIVKKIEKKTRNNFVPKAILVLMFGTLAANFSIKFFTEMSLNEQAWAFFAYTFFVVTIWQKELKEVYRTRLAIIVIRLSRMVYILFFISAVFLLTESLNDLLVSSMIAISLIVHSYYSPAGKEIVIE